MTTQHENYYAFLEADEQFSDELSFLYGDDAGDMRYQPSKWSSDKLKSLHASFKLAGDKWREGMVNTGRTV